MIKVYTGKRGLAVLVLFIFGTIFFLSIILWGITKVIQLFHPLLVVLSYLLIVVFLFGVLPISYFIKSMRPSFAKYSLWMSQALGVSAWVVSFFMIIKAFGLLGILFIFAFKLMIPIALIGAMLKGSWHDAGHLLLWVSFTYAMRYYGQWLLNLNPQGREKGRIIDIDAVEVRDHLN